VKAGNKDGQRWALSFADLCLLLLGFFVLLQARPDGQRLSAGLRAAFVKKAGADFEQPANTMFEPGEAILRPDTLTALRALADKDVSVTIVSRGVDAGTQRFDAWELAAARAAASARALAAAGMPQAQIAIDLQPGDPTGQIIAVTRR
jgi:flagellar motor protein MotB